MSSEDFQACVEGAATVAAAFATQREGGTAAEWSTATLDLFTRALDAALERVPADEELELEEEDEEE
ncbi:MAG TPA: hypothetical protein VMA36_08455 [Candidatus Limnocylindria bacterium]|jgi:hypothetical protein|nr:hypothetical protein [Candidatus Limnocylindria bacterium]